MKCLRCGWCCIEYMVMIVDNPKLGIRPDNIIAKHSGERCKHLKEEADGTAFCAVHNEPWYKETPCYEFTQIEHGKQPCRLGVYRMSHSRT